MRALTLVGWLAVVLWIMNALALGQLSTSSLHGVITDPAGGTLPGATVILDDPQIGFSRATKSGDDGVYQFLQVPPAIYAVTVSAPGFTTIKQANIRLQVSLPATLNFVMQIHVSKEMVEVTSEAPIVNTQDATLGNVFNSRQLLSLPSEGRDPVAILSVQPGVTYIGSQADQTNDSRGGSVSGARSDQTNVTWDGLDNNDQLTGNAFQGALRATLDSLQEFRVTTTGSNADTGRSSGAQVTLVTKSGTNQFHGSLYAYNRTAFTSANDWFNKAAQISAGLPNRPPQLIRNTFGATVGGPIQKDRLFFFAAYEGQRTRETDQTTRSVPSQALRNGTIQYICNPSTDSNCITSNPGFSVNQDPRAGQGFLLVSLTSAQFAAMDPIASGNGTCPWANSQGQCGTDPNVLNIFSQYPLPNTDTVGDLLNFRGFTFPGAHPRKLDTYIIKLDYKLTQNGAHALFVRGNLQNDHESQPPQFPGLQANEFDTNNSKGIAAGYTVLLGNTLINNFRYAFVRQGTGQSGINPTDFNNFFSWDDVKGFTHSVYTNVPVHNFVDDVTWTKGKHTLQFGTNVRLIRNNRASNAQNFSEGFSDPAWLDNAAIANTSLSSSSFCGVPGQCSLDPAGFTGQGYPMVDPSFANSYDFAAAPLAGLLPAINKLYNQDKNGKLFAPQALIPRHFKAWEAEWYLQDAWRVTPHLVITAGLRYSLLQPPYEGNGNQGAPTISMHQWFANRGAAMLLGGTYDPTITFDLSGQANGRKPYWNWDYKDIAPRFAIAYSPHFDTGPLHALFGSSGKSSIRAGYGIYYDHFGEGIVNTFDRNGSFGLTTTLSNPSGFQDVDCTYRLQSLTALPSGTFCNQLYFGPAPGTFPLTPPGADASGNLLPGSFAIYWGMDDGLRTPYSHVFDLSLTRELSRQFTLEASYVGRLGRRLLQETDIALPLDIVDPKSGMDYFAGATKFAMLAAKSTSTAAVQPIPFWENIFPNAAGNGMTATQAMYTAFEGSNGSSPTDEVVALQFADTLCSPACATLNGVTQPFQFFSPQFSSLWAWRSSGNSSYNALQLTLRHPAGNGLEFDFNYTFSKSIDVGSNAERVNLFDTVGTNVGGFSSQVINSWQPNQLRAVSDFDATHQFNTDWVYELPVGSGRKFGSNMGSIANCFLGGWSFSGLAHWSSGLPFSILPGGGWSTNFNLRGEAVLVGNPGGVGTFIDSSGSPNIFKDPQVAVSAFRHPYPGEGGQRNELRGPGYFGIDAGLGKDWQIKEKQSLKFSWEVFNVTNSVRFDAALASNNFLLTNVTNFGKYSSTLTKPRVMQFMLRYSF